MPPPPMDPDDPRTWPKSAQEFLGRRGRATVGQPELAAAIRERIRAGGAMPFVQFMQLALYHPRYGYYTSPDPKLGPAGDFLTGPETHPAFGALVCRRLLRMGEAMGGPGHFDIVEAGAGAGALAAQILGYAGARHPEFRRALRCCLVETSPALRAEQQRRLAPEAADIRWVEDLDCIPAASVDGCILSNELLDALPVHRVQMTAEGLREVYVSLRGEEFAEELGPLSPEEIGAYLQWVGHEPPAGCQAEIGLAALAWYRAAAGRLRNGYLLTVDYGDSAERLYSADHPRGTLLCYHRHTANEEPLQRVGCQDITAHVDFTAMTMVGEEAGLQTCDYTTQRHWLASLGIDDWLCRRERWPSTAEGSQHPYRDLAALVDPAVLGNLKVLVQSSVTSDQ